MRDSTLNTLTIPTVGAINPGVVIKAGKVPLRVLVRNVGPVVLFLSLTTEDLANPAGISNGSFQLPAGTDEVFVLAPEQSIYAVGAGAGGLLSIASSEAFPIVPATGNDYY